MLQLPPALDRLLGASSADKEEAWAEFVAEFTRLFLHVARSVTTGRDASMDAYAVLLETLHEDDFRRLRRYTIDPRSKFTTWLVVVARRICVDHIRAKYGRLRDAGSPEERERWSRRKRLEDLTSASDDVSLIVDESPTADMHLCDVETSSGLQSALECLETRDRLLLALRFDDGLSASEIATILRFQSQFHVYRRINHLLSVLREDLRLRGIETATSKG
jgi:RNA polymerase sigma factor (sigma-70 family)